MQPSKMPLALSRRICDALRMNPFTSCARLPGSSARQSFSTQATRFPASYCTLRARPFSPPATLADAPHRVGMGSSCPARVSRSRGSRILAGPPCRFQPGGRTGRRDAAHGRDRGAFPPDADTPAGPTSASNARPPPSAPTLPGMAGSRSRAPQGYRLHGRTVLPRGRPCRVR